MRVNNKPQSKKADAILCADLHLRDTQPLCRTDNYYETQWKKVRIISDLQQQHNCAVLVAGDVFDIAKPFPMLLADALHFLPKQLICIPGQHDLPHHNLDNLNQSGLAVIEAAVKHKVVLNGLCQYENLPFYIHAFTWGAELKGHFPSPIMPTIALIHTLIRSPREVNTNIGVPYDETCSSIFKKLPGYALIVSGDNHKPFAVKSRDGRLLVNPGSMMRMKADQIDHKPRVYLWYAKSNTIEPVYLPIQAGVVSREHIEAKEAKDERINAFVHTLNDDNLEISTSFSNNMKKYIRKNKIDKKVEQKIYAAMEGK